MNSTEITELADNLNRLETLTSVLHLAMRSVEEEEVTITEIMALNEISGDVASLSTELSTKARRMSYAVKKMELGK